MEPDRYAHLRSAVHSWDPRCKALAIFILMGVISWVPGLFSLVGLFLTALGLVIAARLPAAFVLNGLKLPFFFTLFMGPFILFASGESLFFRVGFFEIYGESVFFFLRIMLRSLALFLCMMSLFGTGKFNSLLGALKELKVPGILVTLIGFTYRYIFLYLEDLKKLFTAARLRGVARGSWFWQIKNSASIMVSLLIRSYEQSQRIYGAMKIRGFTGAFPVTELNSPGAGDILKGFFLIFLSIGVVLFEILW